MGGRKGRGRYGAGMGREGGWVDDRTIKGAAVEVCVGGRKGRGRYGAGMGREGGWDDDGTVKGTAVEDGPGGMVWVLFTFPVSIPSPLALFRGVSSPPCPSSNKRPSPPSALDSGHPNIALPPPSPPHPPLPSSPLLPSPSLESSDGHL